ncbi:hypothetical protein [Streptomyces sp. NPDC059909]|uniref:hypothetical protein n=1 Tax=Streptomyces sp. NPDC059909 TaxID=3346998 RepID=UPI003669AD5C
MQMEYALWARDPEEEILPVIREPADGFVPWGAPRPRLPGRRLLLEDVPEGYRAMAGREALKVFIQP